MCDVLRREVDVSDSGIEYRIERLKNHNVGLYMATFGRLVLMKGDAEDFRLLIPENLFDMDIKTMLFLYPEANKIDAVTAFKLTDKGAELFIQNEDGSWNFGD